MLYRFCRQLIFYLWHLTNHNKMDDKTIPCLMHYNWEFSFYNSDWKPALTMGIFLSRGANHKFYHLWNLKSIWISCYETFVMTSYAFQTSPATTGIHCYLVPYVQTVSLSKNLKRTWQKKIVNLVNWKQCFVDYP